MGLRLDRRRRELFNFCICPDAEKRTETVFFINRKSAVLNMEYCVISIFFIYILNEVIKRQLYGMTEFEFKKLAFPEES